MEPASSKLTRTGAPHPLVTVVGLVVLAVLAWLHFKLNFLSSSAFLTVELLVAVLYTRLARRSARKVRERHLRELEEMRGKPVLHLNDPE